VHSEWGEGAGRWQKERQGISAASSVGVQKRVEKHEGEVARPHALAKDQTQDLLAEDGGEASCQHEAQVCTVRLRL